MNRSRNTLLLSRWLQAQPHTLLLGIERLVIDIAVVASQIHTIASSTTILVTIMLVDRQDARRED